MNAEQPLIGIAITSFNTAALLRACLESLRGCTLPLHIVVVDNASLDDSAAMVRSCFPAVELIALTQNLGFAAGTNIGLRALLDAGTTYQLILNPDTVVHPGAIEMLAAFLDAHPRVGVAGPRLLNTDGSIQPAAFRFPTPIMTTLDLFPPGEVLPGRLYNSWYHGRYPQERADAPFAIDHPLGACMLTRPAVLRDVGLFDEAYFMYAEEVDWCRRIHQAGWAIWQVPAAHVTHVGGAATSQFRGRMLVALYRSRLHYFALHTTPATLALHRWIIRAGMLRATLLAWADYARGRCTRDELRSKLAAYGAVIRL